MKLKYNFTINKLGDEYSASSNSDKEFNGVILLNETGKDIFELLQENTTINKIVEKLLEKYNDDPEIIKLEVEKLIKLLTNKKLIIGE